MTSAMLLVIRHALAMEREEYRTSVRQAARSAGVSSTAADLNDDFRPLTPEGIRKMKKNAKGLRALVDVPELVVTSPLTRAVQTAEILRETWKSLDLATCDELRPDSEPAGLAKWLRSQPQAQADKPDALIALVGHEPHLSSLISWFMTGSGKSLIELKKGGAALLQFPHGFERGRGRLLWLAPPAQLRAAGR